jgi:hypothetical protein
MSLCERLQDADKHPLAYEANKPNYATCVFCAKIFYRDTCTYVPVMDAYFMLVHRPPKGTHVFQRKQLYKKAGL